MTLRKRRPRLHLVHQLVTPRLRSSRLSFARTRREARRVVLRAPFVRLWRRAPYAQPQDHLPRAGADR